MKSEHIKEFYSRWKASNLPDPDSRSFLKTEIHSFDDVQDQEWQLMENRVCNEIPHTINSERQFLLALKKLYGNKLKPREIFSFVLADTCLTDSVACSGLCALPERELIIEWMRLYKYNDELSFLDHIRQRYSQWLLSKWTKQHCTRTQPDERKYRGFIIDDWKEVIKDVCDMMQVGIFWETAWRRLFPIIDSELREFQGNYLNQLDTEESYIRIKYGNDDTHQEITVLRRDFVLLFSYLPHIHARMQKQRSIEQEPPDNWETDLILTVLKSYDPNNTQDASLKTYFTSALKFQHNRWPDNFFKDPLSEAKPLSKDMTYDPSGPDKSTYAPRKSDKTTYDPRKSWWTTVKPSQRSNKKCGIGSYDTFLHDGLARHQMDQLITFIRESLDVLDNERPHCALILKRRVGLDGYIERKNKELATEYSCSTATISNLFDEAINFIRGYIQNRAWEEDTPLAMRLAHARNDTKTLVTTALTECDI